MAQNERIAITIDPKIVIALRELVEERMYPSVSFAIESMVRAHIKELNMAKKLSSKKEQRAQRKRAGKKDKEEKSKEK
jgi:Arc/MetJ-type ribon-helix-helix transcriptional regulator